MKTILRIKWELVIAILLGISALVSWSLWETENHDWRLLVLLLIPTIVFAVWIISYSQIKEIRKEVLKLWS